MLNKEQVYKIIDFVLDKAKGYNTRVIVNSFEEGLTRFANSEIHQNMFEDGSSVSVTITGGKKRSEITTNRIDEEGLHEAVKEAIANLEFLPAGEFEYPLCDSPEIIEIDDVNDDLVKIYDVTGRAKFIKDGIDSLDPGYIAFGALSYKNECIAIGNSKGIKRFEKSNLVNFNTLITGEHGGSGFAEIVAASPDKIDVPQAFETAHEKAKMNQNPEELETGAYTVILEPLAIGELFTYLAFIGFNGTSVQNKQSFLTGKLGQKVFSEQLNIVDDYTAENTLSLPFDLDGYPRKIVTLIENGVAKNLVYDQISAMKDGVETTGHSINNLQMGAIPLNIEVKSGDQTLQEIIKNTKNGILITRFHYMNIVNPRQAALTALTRDGVFKIKDGQLVGAVKNMRFTESMLEALNNITAISSERQRTSVYRINLNVPAMRIDNFHFTGKTDA